jgi:hypothetical protein
MEVDYYSKYLKYKSKYLQLKEQLKGGENGYVKCYTTCNNESENLFCNKSGISQFKSNCCNSCNHYDNNHIEKVINKKTGEKKWVCEAKDVKGKSLKCKCENFISSGNICCRCGKDKNQHFAYRYNI